MLTRSERLALHLAPFIGVLSFCVALGYASILHRLADMVAGVLR